MEEVVMRRLSALAGLLALACLVALGPGARAQKEKAGKAHTVEILDNSFKPKSITVMVGDTVTWVNKGKRTHTATSDDDGKTFDTKNLKASDKSKPVKFTKAGTVRYHCE